MQLPQVKILSNLLTYRLRYVLFAYELVLLVLLIQTWPVRYQPESYFLICLSAFIALPFTISLVVLTNRPNWLANAPIYGLVFVLTSIFLEDLVLQSIPSVASVTIYAVVMVLIIICIVAEAIIAGLEHFFPRMPLRRSAILGVILLFALVFWFKGGSGIVESQVRQYVPRPSADISRTLTSKNLYTAINNYRQLNRQSPLQQNEALEKAAHAFIEKAKKSPQSYYKLAFDEQLKQDLATSSGYAYYKIADIYGTDGNDKTEQAVVDHWIKDEGIRQTLLDSNYYDIGLAFTTGLEENPDAYVIYVLLGNANRPSTSPTPAVVNESIAPISVIDAKYTGVDVFAAVNKSRTEHGVNPLQQRNELCTVASIRLNQQIDLGKLDNHDGFQAVLDKYKGQLDYSRIAENLAGGYQTAAETVKAWEGSPGHAVLLKDGSFVWGCTASNHGFSVLIAAY